jgi:hypothetical protein
MPLFLIGPDAEHMLSRCIARASGRTLDMATKLFARHGAAPNMTAS